MPIYDACIIGAGPSGLSTALSASTKKAEVVVLEEHEEVGLLNSRCGGLVSERCIRSLKLDVRGEYVLNKVSEAVVHSPSGLLLDIKLGGECLVLDRIAFEKSLASKASNENAEIHVKVKAKKLSFYGSHVEVHTTGGVFKSKIVVDAGGALSVFTPSVLGLKPSLKKPIPSVQAEVKIKNLNPDEVHVFLGRNVAPGFFGWIIPTDSSIARVGLACEHGNPTVFLKNLLEKLKAGEIYRITKWPIMTGGPLPKTSNVRFLSVGDAAGQSKPTTGGGIFTGTLCGSIAGAVIARMVEEDLEDAPRLYEETWRKFLGYEFKLQSLYRRIFRILDDKTLDYAILFLKDSCWKSLEDFDYHSRSIEGLLKNVKNIFRMPNSHLLISTVILRTIKSLLVNSMVGGRP